MSRLDLKNNIGAVISLPAANRSDPAVPVNGTGVDLTGYDGALVIIHAGTIGGTVNPSQTFEVQESDDNASFTPVADGDLDGTEPTVAAANDEQLHIIGYKGIKRYIRVSVTAKAGTTPALVSDAIVLRNRGRKLPLS
ncbi:hypothetical protein Aple_010690 [Acrocarpospora pleiomorpha]|uniref:F5/8 type C domain-containing protein n=1 Tax=Acrocarpospora pleiomorpha TaxID=90975 RepID=A0A5M3XAK7_9ACTN|nr:hypothetical protein [Acrocarpospora pleiomorpha]GES18174.1 hypothetical protein Aple_010690 [Acrocarpospora pleiomorpha]